MRLTNFAAIRIKTNLYRRKLVKAFVVRQLHCNSNPKGWASITGYSSCMPSYWHIDNVKDARLTLRARLHSVFNEAARKIRFITTKQCGEAKGRAADRDR